MNYVKIDNRRLAYRYINKGTIPIIMIHGFCENNKIWNELLEVSKLSMYLIDLPGFGESEEPKEFTLDYLASIIDGFCEELKLDKFLILGHSMGGYILSSYIKLYDKAMGYCFMHSKSAADSTEKQNERNKSIKFIKSTGVEVFVNLFFKNLFLSNRGFNNVVINELSTYAKAIDENVVISYIEMMRDRSDHRDALKQTETPILHIIGKADPILDYNNQIEESCIAPINQISIMRLSAHMSMYEEPRKCCATLQEFLDYALIFDEA